MNKQRLMELAGITEAKHSSDTGRHWAVASYVDGHFYVTAPFKSREEAEKYIEWEMVEFDIDVVEHRGEVITIEEPQW